MYRSVVAALLLLLVGGCAGGFGIASPEGSKAIQQAKTVGVISAVGHKFALQKIGITVFGNELNEVAIESWGIDDAVASKISALLSPRFIVKRITYPKGAFAAYESPGGAFRDQNAELQDIVRKIAGSQKHDLYIVVTRSSVPVGSTNQIVTGLGMLEHGAALFADNITLFAVSTVHVYDGRTFERLLWQRSGHEIGLSLSMGAAINAPHRKLDRSWWPATPQAVHDAKLKTATRALVEEGLAKTIPAIMGLDGKKQAKAE